MQESLNPPSAGSGVATPVFLLPLLFSMLKKHLLYLLFSMLKILLSTHLFMVLPIHFATCGRAKS